MDKNKKEFNPVKLFLPTYKITKLVAESVDRFTKTYKQTIGNQLINKMVSCTEKLINCTNNINNKNISSKFSTDICCVSVLLRLCVDLKILSIGRFAEIVMLIEEVKQSLGMPETKFSLE